MIRTLNCLLSQWTHNLKQEKIVKFKNGFVESYIGILAKGTCCAPAIVILLTICLNLQQVMSVTVSRYRRIELSILS